MSVNTELLMILSAAALGLTGLTLALFYRGSLDVSRRLSVYIGLIWLAVWSLEFWIFGSASFIRYYDEANYELPIFIARANFFEGGEFFHSVLSGGDALSMQLRGGEYVSIDLTLFKLFPVWIANLIHKLMVGMVSYAGAYLLCRKATGCPRLVAAGLAAVYSIAHGYLYVITYNHGIGYAVIPLAIYVFVVRIGRRNYYPAVIGLSLVIAASTSPTHSLQALGLGLVLASIMLRPRNLIRAASSCAILLIAVLANWHEVLFAMATYAPLTARVFTGTVYDPSLSEDIGTVLSQILVYGIDKNFGHLMLAGGAAVFVLLWFRDPQAGRWGIALAASLIFGPLVNSIPWHAIGFDTIASIRFTNSQFSFCALFLPVCARAVTVWTEAPRLSSGPVATRAGFALVAAIVGYQLGYNKGFSAVELLGNGSLRNLTAIPNLKDPKWAPEGNFRVVTVPHRVYPSFPVAYGFDTFDGFINFFPKEMAVFWRDGLTRWQQASQRDARLNRYAGGDVYIAYRREVDFRGSASFDVTKWLDVNLLRLGNVSHILSYVPLKGEEIRKVSGPVEPAQARRSRPFLSKLTEDFRRIFEPGEMYVYEIDGRLPRAYFARRKIVVEPELTRVEFYGKVAAAVAERGAVIGRKSAKNVSVDSNGIVQKYEEVRNGFDLRVDAPSGGLLVISTPPVPYWRVWVDGKEQTFISVNGIQTGIHIPPNGKSVTLRYDRPMIRKKIAMRLSEGF